MYYEIETRPVLQYAVKFKQNMPVCNFTVKKNCKIVNVFDIVGFVGSGLW